MGLERRIQKGRYCPRDCGRKLLSNGYNPRSKIDNKQVCVECYKDELYTILLGPKQ
jgi:hypothetical protein